MIRRGMAALGLALFGAGTGLSADRPSSVIFDWFEYSGRDTAFAAAIPPGFYRNPILAGFYPDPSICRVGRDYYLVNSSFTYFPGIPIFHSRDLVHWTQLGNVITRPSQAPFQGLGVSRGAFAPALAYRAGTFYLVTTLVDCGGNCLFTASDPAGPWSDPIWLKGVDGIDPSLFFDEDGRAWLVNNGPPPDNRPAYDGHRAIWIQEFDPSSRRLTGPRTVIVNGGADLAKHPVWIEGPHLFRRAAWYYLICAEGGTGEEHSEVVFRSRSLLGPWTAGPRNPILTQRDLPLPRPQPVTSAGHADWVQTQNGESWAVFLGCRPYDSAARLYATGRETFLLPASWTDDGWPVILEPGKPISLAVRSPSGEAEPDGPIPFTGNFTLRDSFASPVLAPLWCELRTPSEAWWSLRENPGALTLHPRTASLGGSGNPSFLARRLQHARFSASVSLRLPLPEGAQAGIAAFQNETHYFFLGLRNRSGRPDLFLDRGGDGTPHSVDSNLPLPDRSVPASWNHAELRIIGDGARLSFSYRGPSGEWQMLAPNEDASVLTTAVAGGFVGTMVGMYAHAGP